MREGELTPEALAEAVVLRRDGARTTLRALFHGRPALVCFLRNFGCIGCSEEVTELTPFLRPLSELGVLAIFVGNGQPEHIDAWVERHGLADKAVEIVTDPTLTAFRAAGLARSVSRTYGPRAVLDFARAFTNGHTPRPTRGDLLQQGGTLLLNAEGRIVLFHANESLGGFVRAAELQRAAMAMVAKDRGAFFV
jgi:peroxiredoxin